MELNSNLRKTEDYPASIVVDAEFETVALRSAVDGAPNVLVEFVCKEERVQEMPARV